MQSLWRKTAVRTRQTGDDSLATRPEAVHANRRPRSRGLHKPVTGVKRRLPSNGCDSPQRPAVYAEARRVSWAICNTSSPIWTSGLSAQP